jgi:hypothetical protein
VSYKHCILNVLFLFLLSGCSSLHHVTMIAQKKSELQNIEPPDIVELLGGSRDVIFILGKNDIVVDYSKQNLDSSDVANIKIQYQNRPEDSQIGCITINGKSFEVCPYDLPLDIFSIKNVTETYKSEDVDAGLVEAIGEILCKKIYIELLDIENTHHIEMLENFIKKYSVTETKTPPYALLLSFYRKSNNFDGFMKAYKITNDRIDLDMAYKVASEEYQKKEVEDIITKQAQSDLRALAGNVVERVKKRLLGKAKRAPSATGLTCFSIKNEDIKGLCLAETNSDYSCSSVNNLDMQTLCFAKINSDYSCISIKDEDMRNLCLAKTASDYSCFSIKSEDMKNLCLSETRSDYSCISIRDEDIRTLCQVKAIMK